MYNTYEFEINNQINVFKKVSNLLAKFIIDQFLLGLILTLSGIFVYPIKKNLKNTATAVLHTPTN